MGDERVGDRVDKPVDKKRVDERAVNVLIMEKRRKSDCQLNVLT